MLFRSQNNSGTKEGIAAVVNNEVDKTSAAADAMMLAKSPVLPTPVR